ncbi:putative folate-biopterin transporter 7 [Bidens hawaiensis]|uniref:putative folate-biopterin transporter 7 n=1 Tax=Bidens hawaiensis TaxID=980011 RepID=UPI00404A6B28
MATETGIKIESISKTSNDSCNKYDKQSGKRRRDMLLGLGFWVQGFRCFPWMAVNFFLKDGFRLDPATLQILQNSASLPMVAKPFYGLVSDSFYLFGQHRIPYIAGGALLQAISWFAIASAPPSTISFFTITTYLLLGNLGASIVEVANDAVVTECVKPPTNDSDLQSFAWVAASIGGISGNFLGGLFVDRLYSQTMFLVFGFILTLQFFITISISEKSLGLPEKHSLHGIRTQVSNLFMVLKRPEILRPILWLAASYAVIPALTGSMFYYQTQYLSIESSVLGVSKVFGQVTMLLWGVVYNRYLKSIPPRKLISSIQGTLAVLMLSDALFVNGFYRRLGIHNSVYVVFVSGFLEVLYMFKILPFNVLMAKLCPPGCEGSLMAFLMSTVALAFIVSGYFGVALASYVGVTVTNFSGFKKGLVIQAVCTVLPLFWSSCIPEGMKPEPEKKKN